MMLMLFEHDADLAWQDDLRDGTCVAERSLQSGDGMSEVFGTKRLKPLTCDDIALFHSHAGVLSEHLGATSPSPGQKSQKVILADGTGACRRIYSRLTPID